MANHKNESRNESESNTDFDKELQKLKDLAENGIEIPESLKKLQDSDNPLERAFAENIIQFENAAKNPDTRTLHAILGFPKFPKMETLSDPEIEVELERAYSILAEKNIFLDVIYPTPNRELYRFIAEELMKNDEGFISMPEMNLHYIYEEFHPNHLEDLKKGIHDLMADLCAKRLSEFNYFFLKKIEFRGEKIERSEFLNKVMHHLEIFHELALVDFHSINVEIDGKNAKAQASFTLVHQPEKGDSIEIKAECDFRYEMEFDSFSINSFAIPALGL